MIAYGGYHITSGLGLPALPYRGIASGAAPTFFETDSGPHTVSATVEAEVSRGVYQPLRRRVRLATVASGRVVGEAWSDASSGQVSFSSLRAGAYNISATDHTGEFQDVSHTITVP